MNAWPQWKKDAVEQWAKSIHAGHTRVTSKMGLIQHPTIDISDDFRSQIEDAILASQKKIKRRIS